MASPTVLVQNGGRAKSIRLGDTIVVEGALAKDNTTTANARLVTLADGRCLSAGSSGGDVPPHDSPGGVPIDAAARTRSVRLPAASAPDIAPRRRVG